VRRGVFCHSSILRRADCGGAGVTGLAGALTSAASNERDRARRAMMLVRQTLERRCAMGEVLFKRFRRTRGRRNLLILPFRRPRSRNNFLLVPGGDKKAAPRIMQPAKTLLWMALVFDLSELGVKKAYQPDGLPEVIWWKPGDAQCRSHQGKE
jgi:hypothetical protein